ncbi:phosphomannomutase/phosphoglucomutase [bacterium]|nr:phosphomannomutase/phosphoglucomutase [bacterium]
MGINPLIFRAYDIRGIAQTTEEFASVDLTPEIVTLIGKGTGTYLQKISGKNLVVARDNRLHSPKLQKAFIDGLLSTGCNVTNIGEVTSPMMYYAVCKYEFDGGATITASHNPKEYNGVKIVGKSAHSICGDELQEVLKIINDKAFSTGEGKYVQQDISSDYQTDILSKVKLAKSLKIVIDAGNGIAGRYAPKLFRAMGCDVTELYCEPDGNFPNHEANPEELKNMQDLIAKVKETKADIGFGFDGDGDRVGVVDEKGHHYSADYLLLLLARDLLTRLPDSKIVFDVKVSQTLIDDIKNHGGQPVMSKTGHSFIESKMKEIGAPLAGEVSGHLFFAENYYGFDDAFLGGAKLLEILSKSGKTFSHLFDDVPSTYTTPEFKAHTPDDKKFDIVNKLVEYFTEHYDCITLDGVRVNFSPKAWGAVRASNTSPNLTLRFEADSKEKLNEIQKLMVEQLKKFPEVSLDWYEV